MKVFVFDLDFTLWDAGDTWCDATTPPYRWTNGRLLDSSDAWIRLYPDVQNTLEMLREHGKIIVAASRTNEPDWARELLLLPGIDHFFQLKEIYPSSKLRHFEHIQKKLGLPFHEMVFFDDEYSNIAEVGALGVEAVQVQNGISRRLVERYF